MLLRCGIPKNANLATVYRIKNEKKTCWHTKRIHQLVPWSKQHHAHGYIYISIVPDIILLVTDSTCWYLKTTALLLAVALPLLLQTTTTINYSCILYPNNKRSDGGMCDRAVRLRTQKKCCHLSFWLNLPHESTPQALRGATYYVRGCKTQTTLVISTVYEHRSSVSTQQ